MEIKKIGQVYKFDKNNYLIAKQYKKNIQSKWLKVMKDFIKSIDKQHIHSIYLRGSVITGEAVDHVSDIDFVVLTSDLPKNCWAKPSKFKKELIPIRERMMKDYSFIYNVDVSKPNYYLNIDLTNQFMIKHHSVCIYGDNIQKDILKFKRNEFPIIFPELDLPLIAAKKEFDKNKKKIMRYVAKNIIRAAFELVHKISHKDVWTRDLYPCYKFFSEHYPKGEEQMRNCLELAISPTEELSDLEWLIELGFWILEEFSVNDIRYKVIDQTNQLKFKG